MSDDTFQAHNAGSFLYQQTFQVTADQLASATPITGRFAADDSGSLYLNNQLIQSGATWHSWTPFTIPTSVLTVGSNTIDVLVSSSGNPSNPTQGFIEPGVRVEFGPVGVPEGGESAALTLGLGLALLAWRRKKAAASQA